MRMLSIIFIGLFTSTLAQAETVSCFATVDSNVYASSTVDSNLPNLPRVRNQGGFNACVGYASACVAQYYQCNFGKPGIIPCSQVESKRELSPLAMLGLANRTDERSADGDLGNHNNIKFGGAGEAALGNISNFGSALAESCYPFDQVVNKYGNDPTASTAMLDRLRSLYSKNKGKTEGDICFDCINKAVQEDLKTDTNIADIKLALKEKTFAEFLYSVTLGKNRDNCPDVVEIKPDSKFNSFPAKNDKVKPEALIGKIREVLKTGYPLLLDGICPIKINGKCTGRHSLAITGYREQCTKDKTKCRKVVRVQNSWGEDWQKQYDDGWIDAETLLGGETQLGGAISWLTKK